jgi:hypothetical protein
MNATDVDHSAVGGFVLLVEWLSVEPDAPSVHRGTN